MRMCSTDGFRMTCDIAVYQTASDRTGSRVGTPKPEERLEDALTVEAV